MYFSTVVYCVESERNWLPVKRGSNKETATKQKSITNNLPDVSVSCSVDEMRTERDDDEFIIISGN